MGLSTDDLKTVEELICNERSKSCNKRFDTFWVLILAAFAFTALAFGYTYEVDKKIANLATTDDIVNLQQTLIRELHK